VTGLDDESIGESRSIGKSNAFSTDCTRLPCCPPCTTGYHPQRASVQWLSRRAGRPQAAGRWRGPVAAGRRMRQPQQRHPAQLGILPFVLTARLLRPVAVGGNQANPHLGRFSMRDDTFHHIIRWNVAFSTHISLPSLPIRLRAIAFC
jgi:hypothetical protein